MIGSEEFKLNPGAAQENSGLKDFDEDVELETFSFCNLSLNNNDSSYWDNCSKQDRQDFFQFYSEELASTSSTTYSSDSIIFCGKLISFKGEKVAAETEQNLEISDKPKHTKNRSMISSSNLSHSSSKSTERAFSRSNASSKKKKQEKSDHKDRESTDRGHEAGRKLSFDKYCDSSLRKRWNLSPLIKSGSHSITLGVGTFPVEMGLNDILKMRKSKKSSTPARMFSPENESDQKGKSSSTGKRGKSFCGLCRGKASVDCIRQV